MPGPSLTTRVEQPDTPTSDWISAMCLNSFEAIAHPAGEPEIFFLVRAALGLWDNVINFQ